MRHQRRRAAARSPRVAPGPARRPRNAPAKQGLYDPWYEHEACGVGFVVDIKGRKSHRILEQGIEVLRNLEHRGACGCETNTGDGAGVLIQMPHAFLREIARRNHLALPGPGEYGSGLIFLPRNPTLRRRIVETFEHIVQSEGQVMLGWRTVPTNNSTLGETAKSGEPFIRQVFIGRGAQVRDELEFERKLFIIRKRAYSEIRASTIDGAEHWYICSLSHKTIVYKGMLLTEQLPQYYPDLNDPAIETALALVHSRFSTNTFPSWDRAHPYRYLAHNGEINTLRGNFNWMKAREALFDSDLFGADTPKILPVVNPNGSDSAMLDNTLELLVLSGRPLAHAMMMLIPEPWSNHQSMDEDRRAFYQYHSSLMEPWDGPASIAFTDGKQIGAVLDRNGLRPSRYYVTRDDLVIMASEAGVLEVAPENVVQKGRLQPGRMFLVDTEQGRIIDDAEIKRGIVTRHPYRQWLEQHLVRLEDLPAGEPADLRLEAHALLERQTAFGYTFEDQRILLEPMARNGVEAVGSMGNDTPLAVLSERPRLLYDYFKQLFAQVTNPPIDCIREELITASEVWLGSEGNLLRPQPADCRRLELKGPILTNEEFARVRRLALPGLKVGSLSILFRATRGEKGLIKSMEELCLAARRMIEDEEVNILVLSDRGVSREFAAVPALLAVSGLHHFLIREGLRTRVSIVLETGEAREVHHFALLIGYGCSAVNPYLAFETLDHMIREGLVTNVDTTLACRNFVKAATKGVIKVMSKMGISAIQSYHGAQVFEAVGLRQDVIDQYFTWTASRIGGIGMETIAQEVLARHRAAFPARGDLRTLEAGGRYQWRTGGEHHLFNPETIHRLQKAVRTGSYATYRSYARLIDEQTASIGTLRGLLEFVPFESVPLEAVEPIESILRRFKTGAISYGAIGQEAHETLAVAMNRIGGKSNTGEGGEDPARYRPEPNGDSKASAIKQVASGRFGVTSEYLVNARELQIKMAQGAKPGEGGQLPGSKVYPWIAKVRHTTAGVGLISPPPHHDIYSIEDLAELIHDLKNANHHARISVKLVSEVGVGTIAAGVAKAHADVVLISGHDGGTGASPQTSITHAGLPWELGLAEAHQTLVLNNLRSRITIEVDGQLKTGRDVVIAALLGAEEFGFATAPLVAMGCIMMRVCHLNTCPAGVATQDPRLRQNFAGKPEHVVNFMRFIAEDVRQIMAELGFRTVEEMIGRVDRLRPKQTVGHWKAKGFDFSHILYQPDVGEDIGRFRQIEQDHGIEKSLDVTTLLPLCLPALERGEPVRAELPIRNVNRVVGTLTGSELTRRHGPAGLPPDTIRIHFKGTAGQSFGAFMPPGMTFVLEGDANDHVGKGLSGGRIIVFPPAGSPFLPESNIIIGNVGLYGATAGEVYVCGMAGERFAVRNSGADAVVEAVGDHGCEYMTGGTVIVLGPTGRNFGAGMSGGIAYVLDETGEFPGCVNPQMVALEPLQDPRRIEHVRAMIERHREYTGSARARYVLENWSRLIERFVTVMPKDYKRAIASLERAHSQGLTGEEAVMVAFEDNARDLARVGGN
jgi:glutamate synthase (ferredoxin)